MEDLSARGRGVATTIEGAIDAIFGRWPWWPWSVLGLIVAGGVAGAALAPLVQGMFPAHVAALGTAACAGYGIVVAALVSVAPRGVRLFALGRSLARRPGEEAASWWPLTLLAAALRPTPVLRLTPQEFSAAMTAASNQARTILTDRFWPAYIVAFVAPVLGLMTAWANGARVHVRMEGGPVAQVYPALVAAVSPPMVATIGASLALMVVVAVLDQLTKRLLARWTGVVEPGDAGLDAVRAMLGGEEADGRGSEGAAVQATENPSARLATRVSMALSPNPARWSGAAPTTR